MRIPVLLFFLLFTSIGFGQYEIADSLENLIKKHKTIDTTLVNLRQSYTANKMMKTPADTTWLAYNLSTLAIAEELGYEKGKLLASNNVGIVYHYFLSDPLTALDYYQDASQISEKVTYLQRYRPAILANMGLIHYEHEDYTKALDIFQKLKKFPSYRSSTLSYIANIYGQKEQIDSSLFYYKASLAANGLKNSSQRANVLSNMGLIQVQSDKVREGLMNIRLSLKLIDSLNIEVLRVPAYINAAEAYLLSGNLENAEDYAEASLKAVKSLNNLYTETKSLQILAAVQEIKGDYKKALENFKRYSVLNDSLINADLRVEVSRKEIQYEADKKEALSIAEVARQRTVKNASILGSAGIVLGCIIALILYRRKQRAETAKKEALFIATVAEVELKALRAQMNPHFIFNSLNSIADFILKNKKEAASDYLSKFAKLMRMTLENSDKRNVTMAEDIALLETYLNIERKRFHDKFDYDIDIADNLDPEDVLLPPMLLQPFVENSIVHGLATVDKDGKIKISFETEKGKLICTVDDNGVGRTAKKRKLDVIEKSSKGIAITQNRLDILYRAKNTDSTVKFIDKKRGTKVIVCLPLLKVY